ncbi:MULTISPECIES: hypothetical protein [unclassified Streptomyces]|uniref:hypothetical protein n=1 Tax=unclassified Streptomyces TaxID=2593676 RepID=UPI002E804225|nr:hypothetical protein [Streptomyces sp. NBC_00566]WUB90028.1 hypothetical protein OG812_27025 [Streptomyces sp. NBC_00566]
MYPRAVGRLDTCADAGRLALLGAVHPDRRQGTEGASQVGGNGANRVLHLFGRVGRVVRQRLGVGDLACRQAVHRVLGDAPLGRVSGVVGAGAVMVVFLVGIGQ